MTALTQEQLEEASLRLSAGRIRAMEKAPYLSTALLSLTPSPREGFGTFAVDVHWHMYYDPAMCLQWTISEIAAVWLHEVNHVLRKHGERFEQYNEPHNARIWNASADGAINSDLKEMGIVLPDPEIRYYAEPRPETPNWRKGMTAEEMYEVARGQGSSPKSDTSSSPSPDDNQAPSDNTSKDDDDDNSLPTPGENTDIDAQQGNQSDPGDESDSTEDGSASQGAAEDSENDQEDKKGDGKTPNASDSPAEDSSESSEGSENSSEGTPGNDGDADSSQGGTGSSQDTGGDRPSDGDPSSGSPSQGASDNSAPPADSSSLNDDPSVGCDCGSGADGLPRPEDLGEDEDAITSGEADAITRATAQAIVDYEKSRPGTVPGGLKRVANEIMNPEVNWQRLLMVKVRAKVAEIVGRQDYSYKRPSRRRQSGTFIFPSMRANEKPYIYIIIDTSGSMSDTDLARALSEIATLLKRYRGRVYVITCDADGSEAALVKNLKDIELLGGGGTDMRRGIRIAAKSRPTPDIVITITDGYTPWPKTVPVEAPRAKYIALIVQAKPSQEAKARKNFQLPDWFDVITTKSR